VTDQVSEMARLGANLNDEQGLSARVLKALLLLGQAMSQEDNEERICHWATDAATSLMGNPVASIVLAPTKPNRPRMVYPSNGGSRLSESIDEVLVRSAKKERPSYGPSGEVEILQSDPVSGLGDVGINHLVRVPMRTIHRDLGVLLVGLHEPLDSKSNKGFVLTTVANQAAMALENARLHRENNDRAERLASYNRIMRAITSSLDLETPVRLLSSEVQLLIPHARASIALLNRGTQTATIFATSGEGSALGTGSTIPISGSNLGRVIESGLASLKADLEQEGDFFEKSALLDLGIRSTVSVPLWDGDICFGSLNFGSVQAGKYGPDELDLAQEIADQAAVVIINARLYKEKKSSGQRVS